MKKLKLYMKYINMNTWNMYTWNIFAATTKLMTNDAYEWRQAFNTVLMLQSMKSAD